MAVLDIRTYGDPVLREKSRPVTEFGPELKKLSEDMLETMRNENGIGLAAQQVGLTDAICIVALPTDYDVDENGERLHPDLSMPLTLINPVLSNPSEEVEKAEEGCLSFPRIGGQIPRPVSIHLSFQDLEGTSHEVDLSRFLARVVQHEVDHLKGVLFIDHMSQIKKLAINGQLKRMRKETKTRLGLA